MRLTFSMFVIHYLLRIITHSPHCQVVPDCDRHCRSSGDSDSWSILPEITTAIQSTNHIISNIIVSRISILFTNYNIIIDVIRECFSGLYINLLSYLYIQLYHHDVLYFHLHTSLIPLIHNSCFASITDHHSFIKVQSLAYCITVFELGLCFQNLPFIKDLPTNGWSFSNPIL